MFIAKSQISRWENKNLVVSNRAVSKYRAQYLNNYQNYAQGRLNRREKN
jgi:hypothetical protein